MIERHASTSLLAFPGKDYEYIVLAHGLVSFALGNEKMVVKIDGEAEKILIYLWNYTKEEHSFG